VAKDGLDIEHKDDADCINYCIAMEVEGIRLRGHLSKT